MINSEPIDLATGVLVQCPGCRNAFPVSEVNVDEGAVFRCRSCRQRSKHSYMIATNTARNVEEKSYGQGKSDGDNPNQPAASRRRASGDRAGQQQPPEGTVDNK